MDEIESSISWMWWLLWGGLWKTLRQILNIQTKFSINLFKIEHLCPLGCVKNQFFCQINFPKLVMCGNMCQDVPHFFLGFLSKNSVSASHYKIWSLLTNIWCFRVNIPHRTAAWITKFFQQKVIAAPIESNFFSMVPW